MWYDEDATVVNSPLLFSAGCQVGMVVDGLFVAMTCEDHERNIHTMAMEFSGTQTIAAPVQRVWAFLMDVNNVAECAPGFQSLEVLGDEHWKALISVGVG